MQFVIGVDLGGTHLRVALLDRTGQLYAHRRMPSPVAHGPETTVAQIIGAVEQVRAALPDKGNLLGIGIGAPGPLDPTDGIIFMAPNLPDWYHVPLRTLVAERSGLPVELGNDANAAALGEWLFGGGQGRQHIVYITVSTGIGTGVIMDGRLLLGRLGAGTEAGQMLFDLDQPVTWENLASGTALAATAAAALPQHPTSVLHRMAEATPITAAHVGQAATEGDPLARQLMQREARVLGIGLTNVLHCFSPEIILVGGGVVLANPWLLDAARTVAREYAISEIYRQVPIQVAHLGEQVGVLGAAALVYYHSEHI